MKTIKNMNIIKLSMIILLSGIATTAAAYDLIPSNSNLYYQFNGGSDIKIPPITKQSFMKIDPNSINLGYTCANFNPSITVNNTLNNMARSIENIPEDIINSMTAYVTGMSSYLLDKADSISYTLMQNSIEGAMDDFKTSRSSCTQVLHELKSGKSFNSEISAIAESQGWNNYSLAAAQGQNVDVTTAETEIAKDPYQYGIPWTDPDSNAGGSNSQEPIHVLSDVVIAGYNVLVDTSRSLNSTLSAPEDSELSKYWTGPTDAANWSKLVLGDMDYSDDASKAATYPAMGLVNLAQTCPEGAANDLTCTVTIQQKIVNIVSSSEEPSAEDLISISSNETVITSEIIDDIRNLSNQDQAIVISKLGEDISLQNLVDEAKLLRHIIIAGKQTPAVSQIQPVVDKINITLQQLKEDIEDVTFDTEINRKMMGKTIADIQYIESVSQGKSSSIHEETTSNYIENGAPYDSK